MAEKVKVISARAFSKCELMIHIDGNKLNIPINFGMSDEEVRKIYPYLLSLSKMEDNPMAKLYKMVENGDFDDAPEEEYQACLEYTERLAKYWYNKPSTSILDVAIGMAIDMKLNGKIFTMKTPVEDIMSKQPAENADEEDVAENEDGEVKSELEEDLPEGIYMEAIESPAAPEPEEISDEDMRAVEQKYNVPPDSDVQSTLGGRGRPHKGVAGDLDVDIYGADGVDDLLSRELDELESNIMKPDNFEAIIKKDYSNIDKNRYEPEYKRGTKYKDSQINKDTGLLDFYGNDDRDILEKIEDNQPDEEDEDNPDNYDENGELKEIEDEFPVSDEDYESFDDDENDDNDEDEPYYGDDEDEDENLFEQSDE
jgi:hypothetical protein